MTQQPQTGLVVLLAHVAPAEIVRETGARHRSFARSRAAGLRVQDHAGTGGRNLGHPAADEFLLVCFAVLALHSAVVGLYGVMAYNGLRRTREIGVRLALGALPAQIRVNDARPGNAFARRCGLLLGFVGAFALSRLIRSLLFGVSANDPLILLAVQLFFSRVRPSSPAGFRRDAPRGSIRWSPCAPNELKPA